MSSKPKKYIAALLGFFVPPIGMMYVAQIQWAIIYLMIALAVGIVGSFYIYAEVLVEVTHIIVAITCAIHAYRLAVKYPDEKLRPAYSRWYGLLGTVFGLAIIPIMVRAFIVEPFRFPSGSMLPTIPLRSILLVQKWGYGHYKIFDVEWFRSSISATLKRGDIIVFEYPEDRSISYAKRLIGLPGDRIEYNNKRLTINGIPVKIQLQGAYQSGENNSAFNSMQVYTEILDGQSYAILVQPDQPAVLLSHVRAFRNKDRCEYTGAGFTCRVPEREYLTLGDNRDASADSRYWGFVPTDHIVGKVIYIRK